MLCMEIVACSDPNSWSPWKLQQPCLVRRWPSSPHIRPHLEASSSDFTNSPHRHQECHSVTWAWNTLPQQHRNGLAKHNRTAVYCSDRSCEVTHRYGCLARVISRSQATSRWCWTSKQFRSGASKTSLWFLLISDHPGLNQGRTACASVGLTIGLPSEGLSPHITQV